MIYRESFSAAEESQRQARHLSNCGVDSEQLRVEQPSDAEDEGLLSDSQAACANSGGKR